MNDQKDVPVSIRRAEARDLPALARLGLGLARLHVSFDEQRFVAPADGEAAFERFFAAELERPEAVLLIAEIDGVPAGYAFLRREEASLEELRNAGVWLHDLFVDPEVRGRGLGKRLVAAAIETARGLGSDSLMLTVSPHNTKARQLFAEMGLRPTMIEMRIELGQEPS